MLQLLCRDVLEDVVMAAADIGQSFFPGGQRVGIHHTTVQGSHASESGDIDFELFKSVCSRFDSIDARREVVFCHRFSQHGRGPETRCGSEIKNGFRAETSDHGTQ